MTHSNTAHGPEATGSQNTWHTRCGYDQLIELLQICEDFISHASPATRHEIDTDLRARGNSGGPGWLIDMLGLTRLRLTRKDTRTTSPNE